MSETLEKVRVDKWLWATRLFKSRGQAAEACRGGKVQIDGERVKPSRIVKMGELILVQKDDILREIKMLAPLSKRVAAKMVPKFMEDLTPPERFEIKKESLAQAVLRRDSGTGRPTKRDRREIEHLFGE